MSSSNIVIRPARSEDALRLHELHTTSVRALCAGHYSADVIEAWLWNRAPSGYLDPIERGALLVAERAGRVVGFGEAAPGTVIAVYVDPAAVLQGIAVLASGNLAVCDAGRNGILLIDATTHAISNFTGFNGAGDHFGSKLTAKFNQPFGVVEAAGGVLVVTDYGNHRVKVVDSFGTVTNLYGVSSNFWVQGTASQGIFPGWWDGTVCSGDTLGCVEARLPAGVIIAPNGDVYTTEDYYHLIRHVTGTGH